MPPCELCGTDVDSLITAKISGAELDVCPDCTAHGTQVTQDDDTDTSTKYSTSSSSNSSSTSSSAPSPTQSDRRSSTSQQSTTDTAPSFEDDMETLALDYGTQIQNARDAAGYTRADLAETLNIKESHLRNIEQEQTQPDVDLQRKLEDKLDIDLSAEDFDHDQ